MFDNDLKLLNKEQRRAVEEVNQNCLVIAPAGTGKTKVIALRTVNLLNQGISASNILCLTFTNKAAKEMEERIALYEKKDIKAITIKTFHSFCYYLITTEKKKSHYTFPCTIMDEADAMEIIQKIASSLLSNHNFDAKYLMDFIEKVKRYSLTKDLNLRYDYDVIVKEFIKKTKEKDQFLKANGIVFLKRYQKYLKNNNSLDFMDLVVEAKYLLEDVDVATKWNKRFKYIQVDEMQDTSSREYEIISILAQNNNVALFGDYNQTIYEWRGSNPLEMIKRFEEEFLPQTIHLVSNYRSTKILLEAANSYIRNSKLHPIHSECYSTLNGNPIAIYETPNKQAECKRVAQLIEQNCQGSYSRTAILTRTNYYAKDAYNVLKASQIPCIKVDDIKLFRRKEVKDLLSVFECTINERNSSALLKILQHPVIRIEEWILNGIKPAQKKYMHLHDWFRSESNDPYASLLKAYSKNTIVVLDVESTGLDTTTDDIIQIAAIRYGKDGVREKLDVLLKATKKVGDSYYVHGFSDEQLEKEGVEPTQALQMLGEFVDGNIVVGHNVNYDLHIIASMLDRYNMESLNYTDVYDTLDLANKIYPNLSNHKLDTLSELVGTESKPNHNALYDILATSEILTHFIEQINNTQNGRLQFIEQYYSYIKEYKSVVQTIKATLSTLKTYEAIVYLMKECGFEEYYSEEQKDVLRELYSIAKTTYDSKRSIKDNYIKFLSIASLHYSQLEQTELFKNKVTIMTIHQAKGLEFDDIYMIGCNEGIFPSYRNVKEGLLHEEKRLFYVGMTRAKQNLYITYNNSKKKSMFIDEIGEDYKKYVKSSEKII